MYTQTARKTGSMQWMTGTAMMVALLIVLANTPLGLIRLPFLTATTLHIPVIIATLTLGLASGVVTGLVFGVISLLGNLTGTSFFAPFFINPLVSVLPRVLFPIGVYAIAKAASGLTDRLGRGRFAAYMAASALGTGLHTAIVMGMIGLLNHQKIAAMLEAGAGVPQAIAEKGVNAGIAALGVANGLPEALVAALIAPAVAVALEKALGRSAVKGINRQRV